MPQSPDAFVNRTYDQTVKLRSGEARRTLSNGATNRDWWPEQLNLNALAVPQQAANPLAADFDYRAAFLSLDLAEVARDIDQILVTSQDWWPADFGHYGPLVLRMAWHQAGTYRATDGRGGGNAGLQRFAPLNSWPDNRNLDKARRLLWPVKQKYGQALSWADLIIFAGNRALESMGFQTLGFAGGRRDAWEADDTYWGPEDTWFADERHSGVRDLQAPLAASEMGLIYVDPQGPATLPDPITAARDIRQTFARMGFNDEETVALIAGGHTFGKSHGAVDPGQCLGAEPEGAPLEAQGLGWRNSYGTGSGSDTVTSGLEGIWTPTPTAWDNSFFETLFAYEWDVVLSPAGLWQWVPSNGEGAGTVPDPHDPEKTHVPTMLTTDLSLMEDRIYEPISRRFLEHPDQFAEAFAHAWFKLTHLDMGPVERYLGTLVPPTRFSWQDPVPRVQGPALTSTQLDDLKGAIERSGLTPAQLISTAWASASTFRDSDKRGGANGARIRLEPQRSWAVNEPGRLGEVLSRLDEVREEFTATHEIGPTMADLIVLAGGVGIEQAARAAGHDVQVPFRPGRTDATQDDTDPIWFAHLEPQTDAFRNYLGKVTRVGPEHHMIDQARQLLLTPPELTVLIGGLRVLGVNHAGSEVGVLTERPGQLSNDFFVNLLDLDTEWHPVKESGTPGAGPATYTGHPRGSEQVRWQASRVDLIFGSNSQLRAIAEHYASDDAAGRFVDDFVAAWVKVMELDRF